MLRPDGCKGDGERLREGSEEAIPETSTWRYQVPGCRGVIEGGGGGGVLPEAERGAILVRPPGRGRGEGITIWRAFR